MKEPEEEKQSVVRDIVDGLDAAEAGFDLAGGFSDAFSFLGDGVAGILDVISIDF